jgi:hypothetical protein
MIDKVAWDIDGTLYFNVLELDFFGYVDRWGGRDKILPFNRRNPQVCTKDVKCVLTFRPEWWRSMTTSELEKQGFDVEKMLILMNPSNSDMHPHQSVEFKAGILNSMGFDFYIDNDDCLRRNLQPKLWHTQCLSVEEFYIDERDNIRLW